MTALAPLRIDGPPPTPRLYGLVNTPGTIVPEGDPHWQSGVVIDSYPTDLPELHNPCAAGTMRVKGVGTEPPHPEFSSFTVVLPFSCSGIGIGTPEGAERAQARVRAAFVATESWAVERQLALGASDPDSPHFTDPGAADDLGTAGPVQSVALLENAIGGTARAGMIHTDPATFAAWLAENLVDTDGSRAYTRLGTTVIVGDGYIGATIGAALSADQGYAWATGPVRLTRNEGPPTVLGPLAQVLDTETNDVTFRAERNYVAYWDTALLAAVRVDRSTTP